MKYTVIFELHSVLADAVAVEWAETAVPLSSGAGWEPCVRLHGGRWRLSSHDPGEDGHLRDPGLFDNLAIRYRLSAGGAWSGLPDARKSITIIATVPADGQPVAPAAADWTAPAPFEVDGDRRSAAFLLFGHPAGAVAAQWSALETPGEADWQPCRAFAGGAWVLDGPQAVADVLDTAEIRIRYCPEADGNWSEASQDRKALTAPVSTGGHNHLPPVLLAAPALAGAGKIGQEVSATPGSWGGFPVPVPAFQWRRDGEDIPGATGRSYVPVAEDDMCQLSCLVTASNILGSVVHETPALEVTYVGPEVVWTLEDEVFDEGTGDQALHAGPAFSGANLSFSVEGANARIDPATGELSISTDTPVSGQPVTVTAMNSGGISKDTFLVTVEREVVTPPPGLTAGDWTVDRVYAVNDNEAEPWGVVLSLDPAICDPEDYGLGLRVQWNASAQGSSAAEIAANWATLTPVGVSEGQAATVNGTSGQWYLNRSGAGNVDWLFRPVARPEDAARAKRLMLRYSDDDGVTWTNASDVKEAVLPAVKPGAAYWRSPETTRRMTQVAPDRYGRGYQYMRGLSTGVSHSVVMAFGDMCWVRRSEDFGRKWYNVEGRGLEQWAFDSGVIDPHDPDYAMAFGYSGWFDGVQPWKNARGIWRTTNGGKNWAQVAPLGVLGTNTHRYDQQLFAWDPATGSGPASQRDWYFMYQHYVSKDHADNAAYILTSGNGGASWTTVGPAGGKIADAKFKQIYQLQFHPTASGRLYAATQTGLWTTDKPAGGEGAWLKVAGGLPGTKCRSLSIHPDGQKMYASIQSGTGSANGVWYSANGGASWTRVYSTQPVKTLMVDWKTSPATVYVKTTSSQPNDLIIGTGSAWKNNVPRSGMLGYEADNYHKKLSIKQNGYGMLVHPTQAGTAIVHAVGRMFLTKNAGGSFADSTWGLTGINTSLRGRMTPDPTRPQDTIFGAEDIGFCRMADYGAGGIEPSRIPDTLAKAMLGPQRAISSTGAIVTRAGRSIQVVGAGPHSVAYRDPGSATWKAGAGAVPGALGVLAEHPTVDGVLVAGKYRSLNDGGTWAEAGGNAVAMSVAGALYSSGGGGKEVRRATNWTSGSPTWVPFYKSTKHLKALGSSVNLVLEPDPFDENAVYTIDNNRDLIRVRNTGSSFGTAKITALPLKGQNWGGTSGEFQIAAIAADPNQAGLIYAVIGWPGHELIWRGQVTGNSVAWKNITLNSPRWPLNSIDVHPETGDVIIGGGTGLWVFPAPYAAAHSIWKNLPDPVNMP